MTDWLRRFAAKLSRRPDRVRIDIWCPHNRFFPGTNKIGVDGRYGCANCGIKVNISWIRGELDV